MRLNSFLLLFILFNIFVITQNKKKKKRRASDDDDEIDEEDFLDNSQDEINKKIKATIINDATLQLYEQIEKIPNNKIDDDGKFKYIQIAFNGKIYIRGFKSCTYHVHIYRMFLIELKELNLDKYKAIAIGGGRMKVNKSEKTIDIYGYSNRYGRYKKQHEITKSLLEKDYKDYTITWRNSGY